MRPVRQPHPGPLGEIDNLDPCASRGLGHKSEVRHQLSATPEVAGGNDAGEFWMRPPEVCFQSAEVLAGAMDEPLPVRPPHERDVSEDLVLKGRTEALCRLQPVLPARRFELIDAGDSELAVEVEDLLRAQTWDR